MKQVIYSSATGKSLDEDGLQSLLDRTRARNASYGLSGILLAHGRSVLQAIEGSEPYISSIFSRILRDPRHHSINILSVKQVPRREFGSQPMAFASMNLPGRDASPSAAHLQLRPLLTMSEATARRYLLAASRSLHPDLSSPGATLPFTYFNRPPRDPEPTRHSTAS